MVLKDLLSISGQGGLFKFINQGRNGVIVENIETKKRTSIPATAKMSSLEDIAIFTEDEEVPLSDVMNKIFEKEDGKETISHKSDNNDLKKFMKEILPDYDQERVYVSDMKKLVQWYNLLQKNNLLIKDEEKPEKSDEEGKVKKEVKEKKDSKANEKPVAKKEVKKNEVPKTKPVAKKTPSTTKTQKKGS